MAEDASTHTLLLVDDEPGVLSALRWLFLPFNYRVLTAASGYEGLQTLAREPVDLVISDMRMPEMDGAAFLEQVRLRWPRVMRLVLTGHADMAATIDAINRGEIWRYLAKPWNNEEVILTVRDALERQRLTELVQQQNEQLKSFNTSLEEKVAKRTLELEAAHKDLKRGFLESIKVFSSLIELRGGELGGAFVGHSRRVADMARTLAQRISLDDAAIQDVTFAGLLHDIGKIGLSDALLDKPFLKLTGENRGKVMKHPVIGENLLLGLPQLRGAAPMIRHHHECFDGSGYPDHLAGDAIPLGARILAIANDYDALQLGTLVTQRPLSGIEAEAYLRDNRGKRYDPALVTPFLQWLDELRSERETHFDLPLNTNELKPGMTLERDLNHPDGYLLLAAGHVLEAITIRHLRQMEEKEGRSIVVVVRRQD